MTGAASLLEEARRLLPEAIAVRRSLHRSPELGLHLPRTQQTVLDSLARLPLTLTTGKRLSSVVAVLEGTRPGPSVLLRGDMDGLPLHEETGLEFTSRLPGAMHACGHDLHVAMLIGAAGLLSARRSQLRGRVVFMFQPAEESGGGAAPMIDEGVLEPPGGPPVNFAFALHVTPRLETGAVGLRPGPLFASSDRIHIRLRGRGGHAAAPHLALDPVPVACALVQELQTMVARTVPVFDPAVVTISRIQAGSTTNVIPHTADLHGTLRTLTPARRRAVRHSLERLVRHVAAAHGAEASLDLTEGYPPLLNDPAATDTVLHTAAELLAPGLVRTLPEPVMASEDFAYVLERVPGVMALLGARPGHLPEGASTPDCHSSQVVFDEQSMTTGMALHAAVALTCLAQGPGNDTQDGGQE
ncbi:M20 family metallopeptidase [Streptomyces ovatisporus]|uniref:M20 family metallopeptidase n=1 Tax=Streptomyces ovatisporus TaxID=1128682 RepID=A0ABV9A5B0_9ACTN